MPGPFTEAERPKLLENYRVVSDALLSAGASDELRRLRRLAVDALRDGTLERDRFGFHPIVRNLETAAALIGNIGLATPMIVATALRGLIGEEDLTDGSAARDWGEDVARLMVGLNNISRLYRNHTTVESDNFRKLLMTFAEDIRVILIMIIDRWTLMHALNHHPAEKLVRDVAYEANFLYAPLAHRLGLYAIKGEIEDMSLKYTNREVYNDIAGKLNQTKTARDKYIADFIAPVKEQLEKAGLKFDIKGRTKSIFSIWNKILKQGKDVNDIYDLFAIRIIIDTPEPKEKSDCWLAYSVVTDMYRPNPARMKDWISIPKSNGYESLHITVAGPGGRWVEVQIRTRRMDEIAERGLAAHWMYKGISSEGNRTDAWMNNVRSMLEGDSTTAELMRSFKVDFYDKEVFVFTPKGDLYKLPLGATLLDFAFNIHSNLGCRCTGGKVNGKHERINYKLRSGDTVEITTSPSQTPKQDWLNFAVTSKARSKIRSVLKDSHSTAVDLAKEKLQRRFKNRKIEPDEALLMRIIKRLGYKTVTEFYADIAAEKLAINNVIDHYLAEVTAAQPDSSGVAARSANEFVQQPPAANVAEIPGRDEVLVIGGGNIRGLKYRMAKCCNPINGDDVFGFISSEGLIKVHRTDCPNAVEMRRRYPYRLIPVRWSGTIGNQAAVKLNVLGYDDIGIVTNITSIINKEPGITLRSISINSDDGLFQGFLLLGVEDSSQIKNLIKKIKTVKGVKNVFRL